MVTCGLFPQATEWYQTHCWALGPTMKALPNTGRLFALLILGSIVFHLTSSWGLSSASANRACQNKSSCPAHPAVGSCKTDRPHCELESSCPVCFGSCKLQHLALDGRIESDQKHGNLNARVTWYSTVFCLRPTEGDLDLNLSYPPNSLLLGSSIQPIRPPRCLVSPSKRNSL